MTGYAERAADRAMLDLAARAAYRGVGLVEPNPPVGCVIGRRLARRGVEILAIGHHRAVGGPHAEAEALALCRARHADPAGASAWVTLEPCAHHGRTPPCADALIEAGVAEVVFATQDPHPAGAGGAARLRSAGVDVRRSGASAWALELSAPFVHRVRTGRPWVIAKWAQTLDGRLAARSGESKWITGPRARLDAHRLRARVGAVLTGIGTVLADDPLLTARGVPRVRRRALRVVVDPELRTPPDGRLARSVTDGPVVVWSSAGARASARRALRDAGVEVVELPETSGRLDLEAGLVTLARQRGVSDALVEAGPGLLGELADLDLIDEARAYIAPAVLADAGALPVMRGTRARALQEAAPFRLLGARRLGPDLGVVWRRSRDGGAHAAHGDQKGSGPGVSA